MGGKKTKEIKHGNADSGGSMGFYFWSSSLFCRSEHSHSTHQKQGCLETKYPKKWQPNKSSFSLSALSFII